MVSGLAGIYQWVHKCLLLLWGVDPDVLRGIITQLETVHEPCRTGVDYLTACCPVLSIVPYTPGQAIESGLKHLTLTFQLIVNNFCGFNV